MFKKKALIGKHQHLYERNLTKPLKKSPVSHCEVAIFKTLLVQRVESFAIDLPIQIRHVEANRAVPRYFAPKQGAS
jgi:hypothetical protein